MKLRELEKELKKGQLRPAYLLAGDEALLRDDAFAALRAAALDGAADDFNFERIAADSTNPSALRDALGALPVMAERRLVALDEPGRVRASVGLSDALAELLPELAERSDVVFAVIASKADKRQKWVKAFAKKPFALVECSAPTRQNDIASFAAAEAERQGVALDAGAADLLAERIGPQLLLLRQEIAKASLLAGPGESVTRGHVAESTTQLAEQPIWDLTDAIGEGRTADALEVLERLSDAPPPVLLGTLASHFRKLARVRSGERVPGPPFVVQKLERQSKRFGGPRLLASLRAIHEADTALKGASSLPAPLTLERLVLNLAA